MTHPGTRELFQSAARQQSFQLLLQALTRGERGPFSVSGLVNAAKALYLVLLYQATEKPIVLLVDGNKQAETLLESTEVFFDMFFEGRDLPSPQLIPSPDVLPAQRMSFHNEIAEQRAVGLWRLATQKVPITIAPVASALLRTEPAQFYRQLALTLRVGEEISLEDLTQHLDSIGYERREPVEMTGEYSVRGGIFDVFPAEAPRPIRLEFFGDEIESIRQFDVESQRSVLKVKYRDPAAAGGISKVTSFAAPASRSRRSTGYRSVKPWGSVRRLGVSGAAGSPAHPQFAAAYTGCDRRPRRTGRDLIGRRPALAEARSSRQAGAG